MKPRDLKYPFSWEERHVHIENKVWYVPKYYDNYESFTFPGWDILFGNEYPVKLEYCSGNGTWIADKASQFPKYNWVAVEMQFERVRKLWAKIQNRKIHNLFIVCGEAYLTTKHYIPTSSIDELFVNFPDPWPKERHAKHRIIQKPFIEEMNRVLKENQCATLVTDDVGYSKIMIDEMLQCSGFSSSYLAPYYVSEREGYGSSFFEELWRSKGKQIRYHMFEKVS